MPVFSIDDVFRSPETRHRLSLFRTEDVLWLESQIFEKNSKPHVKCLATGKDRLVKPEEIVRQLWLKKLITDFHYPIERIKAERPVWFGSGVADKAADIVIMHTEVAPVGWTV